MDRSSLAAIPSSGYDELRDAVHVLFVVDGVCRKCMASLAGNLQPGLTTWKKSELPRRSIEG